MLNQLFSPDSPYKRRARSLAILWTLLIFILCFIPAKELPEVDIPLADKWVHFILFGVFTFLWLCSKPSRKPGFLLLVFAAGIFTGWVVEELQGLLAFLGRSKDVMDILADSIGGLLGVLLFALLSYMSERRK